MKKEDFLEKIAHENGYASKTGLLMDYHILPTVRVPKHKAYEIIGLVAKHVTNKNNIMKG